MSFHYGVEWTGAGIFLELPLHAEYFVVMEKTLARDVFRIVNGWDSSHFIGTGFFALKIFLIIKVTSAWTSDSGYMASRPDSLMNLSAQIRQEWRDVKHKQRLHPRVIAEIRNLESWVLITVLGNRNQAVGPCSVGSWNWDPGGSQGATPFMKKWVRKTKQQQQQNKQKNKPCSYVSQERCFIPSSRWGNKCLLPPTLTTALLSLDFGGWIYTIEWSRCGINFRGPGLVLLRVA